MLINKKAVREMVKGSNKQVSKDYIEALEGAVKNLIDRSLYNARGFKRLGKSDLL
jgi:hypothetical protein